MSLMPASRPRYLTKSRFKLANECPTKLYYTAKKGLYADASLDDPFLAALAEGGFQVGEMATALFPQGHAVEELDYDAALRHTTALLEQDDVVIFEPAFLWEGMFVRVDVLVKRGPEVELIEVKSKSCEGASEEQFVGARGGITSGWRSYLDDIAFQHYVVSHARPDWAVSACLMLVDKAASCPSDGLHQKFLLERGTDDRVRCRRTGELTEEERESGLLAKVPIVDLLEQLQGEPLYGPEGNQLLDDWAKYLRDKYAADERIRPIPGARCGQCSFKATGDEQAAGLRSGFRECWATAFNFGEEDFGRPTVLEVWNSRAKNAWLAKGRARMDDLEEADFDFVDTNPGAMSTKERQWIQVDKAHRRDPSAEIRPALSAELAAFTFPLHFVDFETMSPAIPLHAGRRPYEVLAFQYSHHVVHEDGRVAHAGDYIEDRVGAFPNVEFVRSLAKELSEDTGTVFRYSHHENTVLCGIRDQILRDSGDIADAAELVGFIESITQPRGRDQGWTAGPRNMVDLLALVKRYYYDPLMGGSNSIKQVLPAVMETSGFLRQRYGAPIYGADSGIPSANFKDQTWFVERDGEVVDPYSLLPTMFEGLSEHDKQLLLDDAFLLDENGQVADGGAAMTAFARMQYTEMSPAEREHLRGLLLKYCELDTLAMVMIFEAWREWLRH